MTVMLRVLVGFAAATAVTVAARHGRLLSRSGAASAIVVGTLATGAGWDWGALLVAFFLASSLLSRVGRGAKDTAGGGIPAKGDERDAAQVLANGGVFALAAVGHVFAPTAVWQAIGGGALAAATADTWSTEIGMLAPNPPRSIITLRRVAPGASGGITALGLLGGVLGASFIQIVAVLLHWPLRTAVAVVAGGIVGTLADSAMGALVQQRRWCDRCEQATERAVHHCGAATRVVGGLPWLDNDGVNAACTVIGALVSAWLVGLA